MAMDQPLFKPKLYYDTMLKAQYHQAAWEYYSALAKKANTDTAANATHVKEYNLAMAEVAAAKKKLDGAKTGKGFATAGAIISFILAVLGIAIGAVNIETLWYLIIVGVALVGLGIFFIVFIKTKLNKKVAAAQALLEEKQKKAQELLDICEADMASLNALLDDSMPGQVLEKVTPIIDLDPVFSPERLCHLMDVFGMEEETDPDTSVLGVVSGHIQGNPFVLEHVFRHQLKDKTYHGELVITWTTTYRDSQGNVRTQTHTQTLHASAVHPAPSYWDETRLIFGSEVAPHLHFTRSPSGMSGKSEREQEKFVRARVKKLDAIEAKALSHGGNFTKLGNDEFEAYFGADDRDNEVEYRLLFSTLAQQNLTELIKSPEPYGDDFYMVKNGMLTSVASGHSQTFEYNQPAEYFRHYDFEAGRERFVNYCDAFIRGLFFDLAPIISAPLYQVTKPRDYLYGGQYRSNATSFEHEAMVNRLDHSLFYPKDADTSVPLILKEIGAKKVGKGDQVRILSRGYMTTPRVDLIPVLGGDGHWHDVPVHWTQYDEVQAENNIGMMDSHVNKPKWSHPALDALRKRLSEYHFERGLLSFYLGPKGNLSDGDMSSINSYFSTETEKN